MKKLLLTSAALSLLAAPAFAADAVIYEPTPAAPIAPVVYDWSGFYVGAQGGYVWTNLDLPSGFGDEDFDGGTLGLHAGFNAQNGNLVYGIEADVNYTWNSNDYLVSGFDVEVGTDWAASVRGRLGYALDRTLIYGTAGLAITNGYVDVSGVGDESETFTGWTVGAGVEHAFTDNWTARIEYRYSDYGSEDFGLGFGDFDLTEHAVRVGVSYRF